MFALKVCNNEGPDRGISEAGPDEGGCETEAAQPGVGVRGWVIRLGEQYLLAIRCRPACLLCVMGEGLRDKMNRLLLI